MSKPIFIVRLPKSYSTPAEIDRVRYELQRSSIAKDYHILTMADDFTGGQTKFECYNTPHTEMEFEELQRRVLELLKD
jgi:hypothetical protein